MQMKLLSIREYLDKLNGGTDPFDKAMRDQAEKCAACKILLQESLTGRREYDNEAYCSDDYYEALGEMIENYPQWVPHASIIKGGLVN